MKNSHRNSGNRQLKYAGRLNKMRSKQKRSEYTVEKILDSAFRIYTETLSTQISISVLSEYSGISIGSIYHHFTDIGGVSAALFSRCMAGLLDAVIKSTVKSDTLDALINDTVRSYLTWTKNNPDAARFIHASSFADYISRHQELIEPDKFSRIKILNEKLFSSRFKNELSVIPEFMYEILIIGPVAETARRWLSSDSKIDLKKAAQYLPGKILNSIKK
jgi:AcrR family transcriptional regulator